MSEFPHAEISNGLIHAKLYLPDPQQGYYRATRFDWSGIIASLEYKGHNYFGPWFERHDPLVHDAITGPVEEFLTANSTLGYEDAGVGGTFVRVGIGALRKPDEKQFRRFGKYDITNSGKWSVRKGSDKIEFVQELVNASGYGYVYGKTVKLAKGKPELLIEHKLKNTGKRPIDTQAYNHNFLVMDGQPSGPDFSVQFPFELKTTSDSKGFVEIRGRQIAYLRELEKGQSVLLRLLGFSNSAGDYDIKIENRKTGAGVRITGDRPLSDLIFWTVRTTLCPEPYITIRVNPGKETSWRISYQFYSLF
jgi:hypothetical protein